MISKILVCTAVLAATVAVVLLSVLTPGGTTHHHPETQQKPKPKPIDPNRKNRGIISLYIQHSPPVNADSNKVPSSRRIFVFDQPLTEGPENTSRPIGRAQGFMLPDGLFASSAFNVFNLNLNTSEYQGSVSIQGKRKHHQPKEELPVVGGTGYFVYARGFAVFTLPNITTDSSVPKPLYHVKLHLRFPRL
eukprot:Gb_28538 [translate_table: standard]